MDSTAVLKMDIFFVVTTVVVALVGILFTIVGFYLIRLVRDLSEITRTVRQQAEAISSDIDTVRTDITEGVHEVRENVSEGIATAKTYTKAIAGAGVVRAVSSLFQALTEEQRSSRTRTRRTAKRKTKGEEE